ncbi:biopolymer transporter ExbD [Halarcobacter sp.]|uniref:ExbD/TolR family protein n=1 Tax=Halarcobacter sp. TaxID=2321133 RepID=UPI002AA639C9|nr:biopolymer transporter ExbD [Halarcobacter sp.]|eukprot:Anaeramoba_ignava/a91657_14.p2 GENE.a91657_14~~a91657_14.p2  ORF type:complete len:129 (-),score=3.39 a91657_14:61-447(-)
MKRRDYIGLDLTPIIDVVFILLIFFIVTSVFKKDELALMLNLPEADAKAIEIKDEQVYIELNENKIAIKGLEVNFISLEENLKLVKNKKSAIIVKIDKDTKYERITKVLDLLQKYNLNNLALVTSEKK